MRRLALKGLEVEASVRGDSIIAFIYIEYNVVRSVSLYKSHLGAPFQATTFSRWSLTSIISINPAWSDYRWGPLLMEKNSTALWAGAVL